ncbi:hypothetical protein ACB098_06G224300 [Castanea mollissima]
MPSSLYILIICFPSLVISKSDILRVLCPFQHSSSLPSRCHMQILLSLTPENIHLPSGDHPQDTRPTPAFS